jgi:hypothetical protein
MLRIAVRRSEGDWIPSSAATRSLAWSWSGIRLTYITKQCTMRSNKATTQGGFNAYERAARAAS